MFVKWCSILVWTVLLKPALNDPTDLIEFLPLSDEDVAVILDTHNTIRRSVAATNMQYMSWNSYLAELSGNWSKICSFTHRDDIPISYGDSFIGENIWDVSAQVIKTNVNFSIPIIEWYDEVGCFNMTSLQCDSCGPNSDCTHYMQVITYNVHEIGCGLAKCAHLDGENPRSGPFYVLVCNYIEFSNWVDPDTGMYYQPYEASDASHAVCSDCTTDMPNCNGGLCATIIPTEAVATTISNSEGPTTVSHTEELTTMSHAAEPTTISNSEQPTTVSHAEEPTTVSHAAESTTVSHAEGPTTVGHTEELTTMSHAAEPTTISNSEQPTTVSHAEEPTTVSHAAESTTVSHAEGPTTVGHSEAATTSKPNSSTSQITRSWKTLMPFLFVLTILDWQFA